MKVFKKLTPSFSWRWGGSYCFYCNVDSQELKFFLLMTIGGIVGSSIFFAIGLYLRGAFKDTEKLTSKPIELELELEGK